VCLIEAEDPPALLGDSLELSEEIGRGGMGSVWKARDLRLGRDVAVKFLRPRSAAPDAEARFEREARALAHLNHPGIVSIHGVGREEGQSYLVMEHVEGRTLAALVPLPVEKAIDVARQLCDALAYAHERGLVHRDVKPENILVDEAGRVKLTDFGIARLLGSADDGSLTKAGLAVGTPQYMAPEALAGASPSPAMDVFSVGVVLYEMVSGRRPIGDFAALPAGLDRVVRKALAPDPAERHANAGALRADLAALARFDGSGLAPEERQWMQAVALLLTLATAVGLWALLASITPRVIPAGAVEPLTMLARERLPDGRLVSRARFETGPTLAAVAALALALASYGALRRHWREAGIEERRPGQTIPAARGLFVCSLVGLVLYGLRLAFDAGGSAWWSAYVPILGGLIEVAAVFLFWLAALEAARVSRALWREGWLWAGTALALLPPVLDLAAFVRAWRPGP
jgi:serine/threonine-protein kinase